MSAARHYKRYMELCKRWPRDPNKSSKRNVGERLNALVQIAFRDGDKTKIRDSTECAAMYQALVDILEDKHLNENPLPYKTGAYGLGVEDVGICCSDEARNAYYKQYKIPFMERIRSWFRDIDDEETIIMKSRAEFVRKFVELEEIEEKE